jgi:hypothetical protein
MCPFCIANLALIAAGAVSTGGAATLLGKKISVTIARRKTRRSFSTRATRTPQMNANPQQRAANLSRL